MLAAAVFVPIATDSKHSAVVAAFGREYAKTGKIEPRYHQMLIEDFEWRQKQTTTSSGMLIGRQLMGALQMRASSFLSSPRCLFENSYSFSALLILTVKQIIGIHVYCLFSSTQHYFDFYPTGTYSDDDCRYLSYSPAG